MNNFRWWLTCTFAALALSLGTPVMAQTKPIKIVTGFAPGGSVDSLARMVAENLQTQLGRPVIVENKTGAAGRLAIEQVKAAPPDGETLLLVPHGPMTLFPHVFKSLRFDPVKDFTPITRVAVGEYALTAGPSIKAKNAAELRDALKAAGDKAAFASPGAGTLPHFFGITIAKQLGVPLTHVPYRGSTPALMDVAGGVLPLAVTPVTEALPLHKSGRVHILATSGDKRSEFVKEVPTMKEFGIALEVPLWFAVYGPARMTPAIADNLRIAITAGLNSPATKERMVVLGLVPSPSTAQELADLQARELQMWAPVVKSSGFTPED